jgi:RNA polymerase sigma-70 factor (ECF subfamily)
MVTEDDSALVARCLEGESSAFEPIVERYQRPLFNLALRMTGRHDEALDATQNAFVSAYTHLGTFDPKQRFFSWIYRILKNECLNVLRKRREMGPLPVDIPSPDGPADGLERHERQAAIKAALLELTVEYREVILLRHFTELSYEEIASTLDIPVKTVKSRLYSARQRLAALLAEGTRP